MLLVHCILLIYTESPAEANLELLLGPSVKGHTLHFIDSMLFFLEPMAI
jgi:hypothetical protein